MTERSQRERKLRGEDTGALKRKRVRHYLESEDGCI